MHYVIVSKSLRKCFISIKGYYFQADINGQKVTWIIPHKLAYQVPEDVDFRVMSTFIEFYSIMLGFVNYKSYTEIGLIYPPKLSISEKPLQEEKDEESKIDDEDFFDEHIASLNCDILKVNENQNEVEIDEFPDEDEDPSSKEQAKLEENNLRKLKNLFKGLKFFLNREVPREPFVFVIRSFSGEVSWEKSLGLGATFQEDDPTITHHVVDRPIVGKTHLNRVYIQPQWLFDSVNENMLLPIVDYLPGAVLPPHLSPFVEATDTSYMPPEKQRIDDIKTNHQTQSAQQAAAADDSVPVQKATKIANGNAKPIKKDEAQKQAAEEKRLRELMISKKDKRLYDKIVKSKKKQKQEVDKLKKKRALYETTLNKQETKNSK